LDWPAAYWHACNSHKGGAGELSNRFNRRRFLQTTTAAGFAAAAAPAISRTSTRPTVISSANGLTSKNAEGVSCIETAFNKIVQGDDVLDALIAGVNIVELDPNDASVGYGGLPDADGVVTLDSCCMHGPKRRAGGVACLKGVRTPSLVAQAVADITDHHLLVDEGAQRFARILGFEIEDDLNTDRSRALWLEWKRRTDPGHFPDPESRAEAGHRVGLQMVAEGKIDPEHYYGTINCNGVNAAGDLCGVTTTSGLAWKIPGRVGDSPILGAGLYVDNDVGAAGSTGRGEANLYNLASFLTVENLRQGMHPKDAGMGALQRIRASTVDPRLLNDNGEPAFNVNFYVLGKDGTHAGVAFYGGSKRNYAVCDENGPRHEPIEGLLGSQN
jgi:N4-(beta-N-acetylglucosaminyl)-L-asparaginase